jgi:hypothetical protein
MNVLPRKAYLAREVAVSGVINGAFSLGFFAALFGRLDPVPVWGAGQFVVDFMPQGVAIGLMATLVPGLLALRAGNSERVDAVLLAGVDKVAVARRALLHAMLAALFGTGIFAATFELTGLEAIPQITAVILKVVFGVVLGAIVTRLTVGWMLPQ